MYFEMKNEQWAWCGILFSCLCTNWWAQAFAFITSSCITREIYIRHLQYAFQKQSIRIQSAPNNCFLCLQSLYVPDCFYHRQISEHYNWFLSCAAIAIIYRGNIPEKHSVVLVFSKVEIMLWSLVNTISIYIIYVDMPFCRESFHLRNPYVIILVNGS